MGNVTQPKGESILSSPFDYAVTGAAGIEQQELSSTDKATLDRKIAVAKRSGWIASGIRHSSEGVHSATMVRRVVETAVSVAV